MAFREIWSGEGVVNAEITAEVWIKPKRVTLVRSSPPEHSFRNRLRPLTLLMMPPLSTTPSAPTMTRSTFSSTYLKAAEHWGSGAWWEKTEWRGLTPQRRPEPRSPGRGASPVPPPSAAWGGGAESDSAGQTRARAHAHSPGGVGLRLGHVDGETLLLHGGFLQNPQNHPGVRVRQDFLRISSRVRERRDGGDTERRELTAPSLMNVWQSFATLFLDMEIFSRKSSPRSSITFLQRDRSWRENGGFQNRAEKPRRRIGNAANDQNKTRNMRQNNAV